MASKAFLGGLPNVVAVTGATVTAGGSAPATMPAANLRTEAPGDVARISSVDPALTWWEVAAPPMDGYSSTGSGWPVDFAALVNHNLSGAAQYRIAGKALATAGAPVAFESVAPNAISGSGVTGVVGSIDEAVDSPDGVAVSVVGSGAYLHVSFATPAGSPSSTDAAGEVFVVRAKCDYDGAAGLTAKLYNSGALVATLGTCRPRLGYGWFMFTAQGLAASGVPAANVELRLQLDSAFAVLEVDVVRWVTEVTATPATFDSGWRAVPVETADPLLGSTLPGSVGLEPMQTLVGAVAGSPTLRKFALYLRDVGNSDGFVQAGVLVAGPAFRPEWAPALGESLGVVDMSSTGETFGGASYGVTRRRRRILPVVFPALTRAEAWALVERLDWRKGRRGGVLVSLFPEATDSRLRLATAWCSVEELTALSSSPASGRWSKSYRFVEKL